MGIYYYVTCEKCKTQTFSFSTQAWGTGNADIVATFKFMMFHSVYNGCSEYIRIISEHDDRHFTHKDDTDPEHLRIMGNCFPCSYDWDIVPKYIEYEKKSGKEITYEEYLKIRTETPELLKEE